MISCERGGCVSCARPSKGEAKLSTHRTVHPAQLALSDLSPDALQLMLDLLGAARLERANEGEERARDALCGEKLGAELREAVGHAAVAGERAEADRALGGWGRRARDCRVGANGGALRGRGEELVVDEGGADGLGRVEEGAQERKVVALALVAVEEGEVCVRLVGRGGGGGKGGLDGLLDADDDVAPRRLELVDECSSDL